jgi:hypothetical protein
MATPVKAAAPVVPPIPVIPTQWNPSTIATFASAAALFVVGLLFSLGVVLPAGTSASVTLWAGIVSQAGAVAASVIALLSHHSVVKTAIKAGS